MAEAKTLTNVEIRTELQALNMDLTTNSSQQINDAFAKHFAKGRIIGIVETVKALDSRTGEANEFRVKIALPTMGERKDAEGNTKITLQGYWATFFAEKQVNDVIVLDSNDFAVLKSRQYNESVDKDYTLKELVTKVEMMDGNTLREGYDLVRSTELNRLDKPVITRVQGNNFATLMKIDKVDLDV